MKAAFAPVSLQLVARKRSAFRAIVLLAVWLPATAAAGIDERRVSFGGFGTIGALYHGKDSLEYRRGTSQPRGAEADEIDLATDTLGGLQVNAAWSRTLEAVVQGVTRLSADDDWSPQLTRAFVRYNANETVSLRAGRIGWEIYPRADSRDVGYSQLGIRPSVEVFGVSPFEHFDGAELTLKRLVGDDVVSLKLYGGASSGKIVAEDGAANRVDGKLWGGHVDYQHGAWLLRLGSGVSQIDDAPPLESLAAALRMTGAPQAVALGDRFAERARRTLFVVAGAAYDEGPLQARLFAAHVDSEYLDTRLSVGQLIGGYRIAAFTPYASFSFIETGNEVRGTGLPDDPQFAPLNAAARAVQESFQYNQQSLALGLRWDFKPRLALKLQVDQVWLNDSRLVLDRRPDPSQETEMTVFGLALDFVF